MENKFLAKTYPRETIEEHTRYLLNGFEKLKELYPNIPYIDWEILERACRYHDLGKMNTKFQNKLLHKLGEEELEDNLPDDKEIPHGYLSPAFLPIDELREKYSKDKIRILYQSIYYHHKREKIHNFDLIKKTIENDLQMQWKNFSGLELDTSDNLKIKSYFKYVDEKHRFGRKNSESNDSYYEYVITKGLLNKLDYAGSAHIEVEEENNGLYEKTINTMEKKGFKLNELQKYIIENLENNNIIRASTGIGKTEAALMWIGNNKGFFTLPLRVSINAIYDRIKNKENINFERTGLLHSDTFREYIKRDENNSIDLDYYDKTKQLSMPLTICTLDQLLDFIFKYEGYELKLATLSYSRLIIDEIQMYSPEMLGYLIIALKFITEAGGKYTILTATFPNFILKFFKDENIDFKTSKAFCKLNEKGETQIRHKIEVFDEYININHVLGNYKNKKVLIIVNTVRQAQKLFAELKDAKIDANMFHSRFIKKDRSEKEKDILNMGERENKECGIWITTQVVEASLDIDFDVLYTELSDVSGLFQRMGRVYRGRELDINVANVYVYVGEDRPTSGIRKDDRSIVDIDIFNFSKMAIKEVNGQKIDEDLKMKIVNNVYSEQNLVKSRYYKKVRDAITWAKNIKEYELNKNEARLRNIVTYSIIPKSVFEKNKNKINKSLDQINKIKNQMKMIENKNKVKQLYIEIQKEKFEIRDLTVDIPGYMYETALRKSKIIDYIEVDKFTQIPVVGIEYSFKDGLGNVNSKNEFDEDIQFI